MSLANAVTMFWNNNADGKEAHSEDLSCITAEHVSNHVWEITRFNLLNKYLKDGVGLHLMKRVIAKVEEKTQGRYLIMRQHLRAAAWKKVVNFLVDCGFQEGEHGDDVMIYELRGPYHHTERGHGM